MNTNRHGPRCSTGQQLWEAIDRAKASGNRETKKFRAECRDCLDYRREAQGAQP